MNVGFLIPGSLEGRSGGYLYDRCLARYLRSRNVEVSIITIANSDRFHRRLVATANRSVRRRLRHSSFDVLIQDELAYPSLALTNRFLSRIVDYPLVSLVHSLESCEPGTALDRRLRSAFERRYLETVDGVISNSRATKRAVSTMIDPDRHLVAYPGRDHLDVDPSPPTADRYRTGPIRVLFVGNIIPRKGLIDLVMGMAEIDDDWQLTVVGDLSIARPYVERVRRTIGSLGVRDHIRFTGPVSQSTLLTHFATNHILAVPARYEAFGIVYVEAMGFGVVPLGSTAGGGPEVIGSDSGLLVPPSAPAAIAETIGPLASDRERLADLGRSAYHRYEGFPTWTQTGDRILEFLEAVVP